MIESNWVRQAAGAEFLLVDKRVFRKIVEREKVRTIRLPGTYPLYFLPDLADIAKDMPSRCNPGRGAGGSSLTRGGAAELWPA